MLELTFCGAVLHACRENLAPPSKGGGGEPDGELAKLIEAKFGSFDKMKTSLSASAVGVQGSGWGWLGYDKATDSVAIATCANQVGEKRCIYKLFKNRKWHAARMREF
jgi:superoxide dismutase